MIESSHDPRGYEREPGPRPRPFRREHFTCHRVGDVCAWNGCPNQHDDRACEGCFLIQADAVNPPGVGEQP